MMPNSIELKEYSARHGLAQEAHNLEQALLVAEDKYRTLVGREPLFQEIREIRALLDELHHWKYQAHHKAS